MKQTTLNKATVYTLINEFVDSIQGAGLHFIGRHMYKSDAEMARRIEVEKITKDSVFDERYTADDVIELIQNIILDDADFVSYVAQMTDKNEHYYLTTTIKDVGRIMVKGQSKSVPTDTLRIIIGKEFDAMGNIKRLYIRSVYPTL